MQSSLWKMDFYSNSTRKFGCEHEARRLRSEDDNRGDVYLVREMDGVFIEHFYYVPWSAKPEDPAKNQKDNGFEGFPALTVEQVRKYGRIQNSPVRVDGNDLLGFVEGKLVEKKVKVFKG